MTFQLKILTQSSLQQTSVDFILQEFLNVFFFEISFENNRLEMVVLEIEICCFLNDIGVREIDNTEQVQTDSAIVF